MYRDKWYSSSVIPCDCLYFYNGIPNIIHTNLSFFANDSKLYTVKTFEDTHMLQADLDSLLNWCHTCMVIKIKCKVMHVGYSRIFTKYYTLCVTILESMLN